MSDGERLADVVRADDRGDTLRALRDRLAAEIDGCGSSRDVAALSARLVDVVERIAALPAPVKGTALDELRNRRAARGAAS